MDFILTVIKNIPRFQSQLGKRLIAIINGLIALKLRKKKILAMNILVSRILIHINLVIPMKNIVPLLRANQIVLICYRHWLSNLKFGVF
jgi:ABC-type uncharacterized transport system permease subunit